MADRMPLKLIGAEGFESESTSFLRKGVRQKNKRKSKGNRRSDMLKLVMPHLSSRDGEELQDAIARKDGAKAEQIMRKIGKLLRDELERQK